MKEYKLRDISLRISSGLTPLRSNKEFWENGNIPWLKTEQLGEVKYIYDTNEHITEKALKETSIKLFPENTLSIAMYGEGKTRGNLSIIKTTMTTNQACCNIEIDPEKADFEFVYYFLKTQYEELRGLASGARKNLNSDHIKNFSIRLPELKTQQKIAQVLSTLDRKIALNQQINAELEKMAKTLYDYWFVQFDFPDENGKPYKSSGGEMVWNDVLKRKVPKGWGVGTLDDIGQIVGGSTPSTAEPANFSKNATAWITPNDLSNNKQNKFISHGSIDVSEQGIKSASLKIYPKGTVLLSSRAPVGYMAIAQNELTTNQGFKSFIPNKGYSEIFIYYVVKNLIPFIEQNSSGSTFKEVSATTLKNIICVLPQKEIIKKFESKLVALFEQQSKLEKQTQTLTQYRDFLLPMLMNGQVEITTKENNER